MIRSLPVLVFAALSAGGASLHAQARPKPQPPANRQEVPRTHLPPPGMCRIWLDNVPPAQQPAPTDCASAVRNQPRNGRVIFNDEPRNPKVPLVKSLKEPPPPPRKAPDEPATPVKAGSTRTKPVKPARPEEHR